jgi:hypothetical protein
MPRGVKEGQRPRSLKEGCSSGRRPSGQWVDGADFLLYEGPVVALASSERFEAMVSVCGGSYKAKEMVRLRRVQVNEDGSGSFDAESLCESAGAPGKGGCPDFRHVQVGL